MKSLVLERSDNMHFITLPRVANFVFNPISVLILFDKGKPTHLFAEVHNYNGGRVVYPVKLETKDNRGYEGEVMKDMYVSPFLETKGEYRFFFRHEGEQMIIKSTISMKKERKN